MRKRSGNMKQKMMSLLLEYLKDSKRSDREIAKVLGVSQPTITRMRQRLVKEAAIKDFTVIPDFVEMGYEIVAVSCFKLRVTEESMEKAKKVTMSKPNIIFASSGHGMRKDAVMISLHKNYTDFSKFLRDLRLEGGNDLQDYNTMLISLEGRIVKPFSLTYLGEQRTNIEED